MINLRNILVATDFGEPANTAWLYGRDLARAFTAALHLVHVVDDLALTMPLQPPPVEYARLQADLEHDAQERLGRLVTDDDRRTLNVVPVVLTSHLPAQALLAYARDQRIDMIIVGTHGRGGLAEFFLGSVAQKVVRSASCPVLTVREGEREFIGPDALLVRART